MNQASRRFSRTLAILLLAVLAGLEVGAQEPPAQLQGEATQLYKEGRYTEAIPLAERALAIKEKTLGPDHPETAASLDSLGKLYMAAGAYAKAAPLLQRALAIREQALGPNHPDTAASLDRLGELYTATGAYAKAAPLLERALAIREQALGPAHPDTAASLNSLGTLYLDTGAYAKAQAAYQRALAIDQKVLGDHPDTAAALHALAEVYAATGAYAQAEPLFQRALAIDQKVLGEHPDIAFLLSDLGDLYRATGRYARAEPLYQQAIAISEQTLGPAHPLTANFLGHLAQEYLTTGQYAKAEPLAQRALAILEKTLGPQHPQTAEALNNLAVLYRATGQYTKAEPLYSQVLAINEKSYGPAHPVTAIALNNLAALYVATGAYAKAEPLYQRALAIDEQTLGPAHPTTAVMLNNLAELYHQMGAYAKAEPLYQRALAITLKALGARDPRNVLWLDNLGQLYHDTGEYAKAEALYKRALALSEKGLGPTHPDTAHTLYLLADLYSEMGSAKGKPLMERALAIRQQVLGPDHPDTALSLQQLARFDYATGAYPQAQALLEQAEAINERNTRRFLLAGSQARQVAYLQAQSETTATIGTVALALAYPTARTTDLALTAVLRYKGRVLDAVSDSVAQLRRSVAPQDQALFDQLASVAQQSSALTYNPPPQLSSEALKDRLQALAARQDQLQAQLASRSAAFEQALSPITGEGVRQALPERAVLVEWFRYALFDPRHGGMQPPWYMAFLVTHSSAPVALDVGPAKPIDELIAEYRGALRDPSTTYYKDLARELSQRLLTPLLPHLVPGERLLICPDAALNLVPFAALTDAHGDYLVQHFEISYLTSGSDLLRMATEPAPQGPAVVVADPSYGRPPGTALQAGAGPDAARPADLDRSGLVFTPLPGTLAEARALQSVLHLDARHVLTGERATEQSVKALHGPRILHLATHAFFLGAAALEPAAALQPAGLGERPAPLAENPLLRAGLALAGANARRSGADDDGILTAAEAAQLDLVGTQLVVLSACETGVGTVQTGEGVFGLRRALVLAGAQAQLVSLWKVDDAATQDLMVDDYRRLLQGEGRSAALRAAQPDMLASPTHRHPFYWAAFIPIGDWRPLAGLAARHAPARHKAVG